MAHRHVGYTGYNVISVATLQLSEQHYVSNCISCLLSVWQTAHCAILLNGHSQQGISKILSPLLLLLSSWRCLLGGTLTLHPLI
jgi:hypothetical protein